MKAMLSEKKEPVKAGMANGGDGLETTLLKLWHTLLPESVNASRTATFAELGGSSLYVLKLMLGVEEIIGMRLEASNFMVQPTFDGLCQAVKERLSRTEFQPVLIVRKHGTGPDAGVVFQHITVS